MSQDPSESFVNTWYPNPIEESYELSDIEGEIPRELNGTLYRNGPCQKVLPESGARGMHLFDGDGLVRAIRFDDGRAHHTSAFAKTPHHLLEQELGRYLGGGNLPSEVEVSDPPPAHQANTNVVAHAGRLFALVENAPPFELDPVTLESKGYWDYDGKMLGLSTTAHPKIDARTGQMVIHGYMPVEPYIQLYVVEPDGSVSLAEAIDAPWASMMHDFAITENYVILPLGSVHFDFQALAEGRQFSDAFKGRPDWNLKFGIRRREPGSPTRWFDAPSAGYMFHPGNAYEKDGRIYMDACTYEDPTAFLADLSTARDGRVAGGVVAHPHLYEFDLATGTCKDTRLSDIGAEFPRIDDRLVGYENRWGYASTAEPVEGGGVESIFRRITKYDRTGGPSVNRKIVPHQWIGEPVFVPRAPDAEEDDGFVLYLMCDGAAGRTALEILDARGIDQEPLARVWLRERAPMGFHGNYLPDWS
jgi:carotenoid cleavage dioxygenase